MTGTAPTAGGTLLLVGTGKGALLMWRDGGSAALDARYPGMLARLLEPDGALRRYVNVFVDGEDVRWFDGVATAVPDGAELRIVPSVAGG